MDKALSDLGERCKSSEIAFFGGSFTALDREYMLSLLNAAKPYLNSFYGVRVSTRPDYIDDEVLDIVRSYGVTAIELGAQSMDNSVLELNQRGHTAKDVEDACALIREHGFSLGLQMMTGLYGSTIDKDIYTAERFIELKPDTVRVYPTVILENTDLAKYFFDGIYKPYPLEISVELCAKLILMFAKADIEMIRLGLHDSESLRRHAVYDNYHPAFKELCENKIFLDSFLNQTKYKTEKSFTVYVNPKSLSKFLGQKKSNYKKLCEMGYDLNIQFDDSLGKYDLHIS